MGDEHTITAHELRLVGHFLDDPKQTVIHASSTLFTTLDGLGEPWGDDETGLRFAEAYVPARDKVFETLRDLDDGFFKLQSNIFLTADNYESTEQHNSG